MPNKILLDEQNGTPKQIVFRDVTDFAPTAANDLRIGTPTLVQLDLTSVADNGYRQSTKVDLGAVRAPAYAVRAALEIAATPVAGEPVYVWWAPSPSATAGTANAAAVSGADSAYTGYSSNADAAIKQLTAMCIGVVTAQATATVQVLEFAGQIYPTERYGSLVFQNQSGAALFTDAVEMHIVLDPIYEEVQ
jgi:hypothetical protein